MPILFRRCFRGFLGLYVLVLPACAGHLFHGTGPAHPVPLAVPQSPEERAASEATGKKFIVSTQGKAATEAAKRILDQGGNVIDAAVAASFAISVERPHSSGLGGGGFLLYREAKTGKVYAIDFRERAPRRARATMFQDAKGNVLPQRSIDGILSVAVPGLVAGITEIQARFGRLPLEVVVQPAIELAENGFAIYPDLARALADRASVLAQDPAARALFLKADGKPLQLGDMLVQKDLAQTLRLIAKKGAPGFYSGEISHKLVKESRRLHGIIGADDLTHYKVKWRDPVRGRYHGWEILSMPPPSSGGALVIEILQMLQKDPLASYGPLSTESIHLEASAMQRAFADRAAYLGDPDFVKVPARILTSQGYADERRLTIRPDRETPSTEVSAGGLREASPRPSGPPVTPEPGQTTHFSILDAEGNAVASTQTINGWFGSGLVLPGTGIVLNDEMDDFSAKAGASNQFGAVGGDANAVAPGKTPLSSMSPTIVMEEESGVPPFPRLVLGAPGGTRILTCVAQTILNYLEFQLPLYQSVDAVRFHHQWKPDELWFDAPGAAPSVLSRLSAMGYTVRVAPGGVSCRVMAVSREADGTLTGVSDPRDAGQAAGG